MDKSVDYSRRRFVYAVYGPGDNSRSGRGTSLGGGLGMTLTQSVQKCGPLSTDRTGYALQPLLPDLKKGRMGMISG